MATATKIVLSATTNKGIVYGPSITQESADRASHLLNKNHQSHHILFNQYGLHNHIAHHLLCIYALGATPDQLQRAYDVNREYQRPADVGAARSIRASNAAFDFEKCVGNDEFYVDFLVHFENEIDAKGVPAVVNEYLFSGDARAEDMYARMNSGLFHPMIHLGYGLEFDQPAIVAEAFAQAAVHKSGDGDVFFDIEKAAAKMPSSQTSDKTIMSLMDDIRADEKVSRVTTWENQDVGEAKWRLLWKVAPNELAAHLTKYSVTAERLEEQTAEMIQACAWMTATAQHPRKIFKADFFSLHLINASLWYSVFLQQDWISEGDKCRLLQWKVWQDLQFYAANRAPPAYPERIESYSIKEDSSWDDVFARAARYRDEGHTSKFIRTLKHVEAVSKPYYGTTKFPLLPEHLLKVAYMTMDTVEIMDDPDYKSPEKNGTMFDRLKLHPEIARVKERFVRWSGFEQAWEDVPTIGSRM